MASEIEYRAASMVYWFLTQISIKKGNKKENKAFFTNTAEIIEYIYEKKMNLFLYIRLYTKVIYKAHGPEHKS